MAVLGSGRGVWADTGHTEAMRTDTGHSQAMWTDTKHACEKSVFLCHFTANLKLHYEKWLIN